MLTDLYLQKYLEGRLSPEDENELRLLLEKNPDLKTRLEDLEERSEASVRHMWERTHVGRNAKRGSRVRYTTLLPGLLILILVVVLASHWFSKPGENSTFIHAGGNGTAVELLYNSSEGWRYIDVGFRYGDSITFSVRDAGKYSVRVFGIYPGIPEMVAEEIWKSPVGLKYAGKDIKPVFTSKISNPASPRFLAVVYDTASLEALATEDVPGLLHNGSGGGRTPSFHYQVFRVHDAAR